MKILEKYVFKSFISSFFFCITLLMVLGIIGDVLGFLDDIVKNNIPLTSILAFYFYLAPFAFVNMVPFACLLAAVYVFNSLSKNHEITAFVTSGLSLWKLVKPVLFVTFILCLATFIVNDRFVPSTMKKSSRIRQQELEHSDNKSNSTLKEITIYGKGNQIIYAKSFVASSNTLNNIIIHRQDKDHRIFEKINVRVAEWQKDGSWMGQDVMLFKADSEGNFSRDPEVYRQKKINIIETPQEFINNQWDPKFMSYKQLKEYLRVFRVGSPPTLKRLLVDLNYKIALPFTAIITVLVGVPFCIETGRASALIGMARGITIAILYLPVMAISLALGKGGIIPPFVAAWLSIVLFAGIGAYNINKKS
ncbi:MAG: LptF/LptG family permease [Candidatus Omnitrophota bacterium]|nr:LptF/LptG family permease [Candidatus Omnitrophota bacterium]